MALDDLSAPLGVVRHEGKGRLGGLLSRLGAVLSVLVLAGAGAILLLRADPLAGEPHAVAVLERIGPKPDPKAEPARPDPARPARESAREIEAASGVRVTRPGNGAAPGAIVITVPDAPAPGQPVRLAPPDSRLFERARHGQLPRIASDGSKPAQIYARPFVPAPELLGKPRIAIVVTGLGIGAGVTAEAIAKLPGEVSLAFAPYGSDLERQVARARSEGHEVLLQVPMEPFDYPDSDPGPHTLRVASEAAENIDRLHWLMSRFQGFIGITNFMGGRFTATEAALKPVLQEVSKRGLMVFDDGTSLRSAMFGLGLSIGAPVARADVALDGNGRGELDDALQRLEKIARERGSAVGVAPALPGTIDRIARWARDAEQHGIVLAPLSAMAQKPRP